MGALSLSMRKYFTGSKIVVLSLAFFAGAYCENVFGQEFYSALSDDRGWF
jgi:hypothetical protein